MRPTRTDGRAWSDLIRAANDPHDIAELQRTVRAVAGKVTPCPGRRDQSVFVALQGVARAYAEAQAPRRRRLEGSLATLAKECAQAAGWDAVWRSADIGERPSWVDQDLFESA